MVAEFRDDAGGVALFKQDEIELIGSLEQSVELVFVDELAVRAARRVLGKQILVPGRSRGFEGVRLHVAQQYLVGGVGGGVIKGAEAALNVLPHAVIGVNLLVGLDPCLTRPGVCARKNRISRTTGWFIEAPFLWPLFAERNTRFPRRFPRYVIDRG